ncbi:PREDICTED: ribosome production factor 2 homolog [Nicrophorus vespilloides]|uniref:Ribosome production factor 2 homolog n=1 Tax=Nicrophorus vespilloides TaxID=110193 RepID=A0ABM1NBI7_NICVS|nr:PREDICTED: ribosome production factor 2 homolog [Nicrophorus vespilloides]
MAVMQRVVKAKTRKGKKVLVTREPQLIEGVKRPLFLQGRKCSEKVRNVMKDIYHLKKPEAVKLSQKNDITIFENVAPVEQFCKKYQTPIFMFGSHNKKRPDNLVVGRMFNYSLLDMIELAVDYIEPMSEFKGQKMVMGTKPMLVFNGPSWDQSDELKQLKSIFVDFFKGEKCEAIRLAGLEHAISFTVTKDGRILLRSYKVLFKKSGCKTPRIEMEEIGPRIDFTLRRSKLPTEDLMKQSCRKPKELKVVKKKNISTDGLGTTHGRVHLGKQEVNKLQTRKMKGLKKSVTEKKAERKAKKATKQNTVPPVA